MVKFIALTVLLAGVLSMSALEVAAAGSGTPITCPATISAPGKYFLAADCSGSGIAITSSNVTLNLKRHTMDGFGSGVGIGVGA